MLAEAVIIAVAEVIKAITELAKVMIEGQSPEQRAKMWQWYIDDVERWRSLLGLDKPK